MATMMIWQVIPLLVVSLVWVYWRYKNRRLLDMAKAIPGPPAIPLLGNALKFMCQPEELIQVVKDLVTEYGDVIKFWLANDLNIVVSNPEDIRLLLTNNKTNKKGPQYKYMADVLGTGILSGSGAIWRKHRKLATPNYGKKAIQSYNDIFNIESRSLVRTFQKLSNGEEIDIYKYIVQTTSWTVCQTLMGLTKEETMELPHLQTLIDISPDVYDIVFKRMTKWYLQIDPVFWLTNQCKNQKYYMRLIDEFGKKIIKHRMQKLSSMEEKLDILNSQEDSSTNTQLSVIDRFILSNELNYRELIDETFTIFTSSQEASAKIASFLLLMMAFHPICQEKLYQEIKQVIGDKDTTITDEHLKDMPYLEMAFKEVIRLFPIGGMIQRTIKEDISISSCTLPAGSSLVIPVYHIQRDPKFWKNPDIFDPERFTPENSKNRPTYCYIPFSLGPMDCLGRYFGAKLIKTIVVKVLQEFKLSSSKSYKDLRIAISISATSLDGHHAILIPRHVVALWQGGDISEFTNISTFLQSNLSTAHTLSILASAEEGLALEPDEVVVCSMHYDVPEMSLSQISLRSINGATLKATDMRSCLLNIREECKIQDLTLQCTEVNTIIVMQAGTLHINNCMFTDDSASSQSDFTQGIVARPGAKIVVENTAFENFYSGIVVHKGAQLELRNCHIKKCGVGIQMYSGSHVKLDGTIVSDCTEQSVRCEVNTEGDAKNAEMEGLQVMLNCKIGSGDLQKEVFIVQQDLIL